MSVAVRAFARDALAASADVDATNARHGAWFAAIAERFSAASGSPEPLPLSLLAPDEGDVLAALQTSMRSDTPLVAYRILARARRNVVVDRSTGDRRPGGDLAEYEVAE